MDNNNGLMKHSIDTDSPIKKKYQVFISSTFNDLIEERMAVTQCLLDNDCIPIGMEQFSASDMDKMEYIERVLEDCDYYILILAGRYGSLDKDGVGDTEKEYLYAESHRIPIMSFVIKDPNNLTVDKSAKNDDEKRKLSAFRDIVCNSRTVKFYENKDDLKAAVATSINRCIKDFPAVGWVRGYQTHNTEIKPSTGVEISKTTEQKIKSALQESNAIRFHFTKQRGYQFEVISKIHEVLYCSKIYDSESDCRQAAIQFIEKNK